MGYITLRFSEIGFAWDPQGSIHGNPLIIYNIFILRGFCLQSNTEAIVIICPLNQ